MHRRCVDRVRGRRRPRRYRHQVRAGPLVAAPAIRQWPDQRGRSIRVSAVLVDDPYHSPDLPVACHTFAQIAEGCACAGVGALNWTRQAFGSESHRADTVRQVDQHREPAMRLQHTVGQRYQRSLMRKVAVRVEDLGWGKLARAIYANHNLRGHGVAESRHPLRRTISPPVMLDRWQSAEIRSAENAPNAIVESIHNREFERLQDIAD